MYHSISSVLIREYSNKFSTKKYTNRYDLLKGDYDCLLILILFLQNIKKNMKTYYRVRFYYLLHLVHFCYATIATCLVSQGQHLLLIGQFSCDEMITYLLTVCLT